MVVTMMKFAYHTNAHSMISIFMGTVFLLLDFLSLGIYEIIEEPFVAATIFRDSIDMENLNYLICLILTVIFTVLMQSVTYNLYANTKKYMA